jgi:hypothetical protein
MSEANDGTGAGLDAFLDWAGSRGEMNQATAQSFRVACKAVLSLEHDPETIDVRALDVEALLSRFETLNRTKYSSASMGTYKSRFRSSVAMYLAWLANDPGWKPSRGTTVRSASGPRSKRKPATVLDSSSKADSVVPLPVAVPAPQMVAYDLPLRPDLIVRLTLPVDLTLADSNRVAAFVRSLAFSAVEPSRSDRVGNREDDRS